MVYYQGYNLRQLLSMPDQSWGFSEDYGFLKIAENDVRAYIKTEDGGDTYIVTILKWVMAIGNTGWITNLQYIDSEAEGFTPKVIYSPHN